MRMMGERAVEVNQDLYLCFVDNIKAFDRVKHETLMSILADLDIFDKDLRLIQSLYYNQTAAIRHKNRLREWASIKRGVRQSCVQSPHFHNLYSEQTLRALDEMEGIKVNGRNITNIRYADDTVLLATSEENLQELVNNLVEKSAEYEMALNPQKTECMVITKRDMVPQCHITVNRVQLKQTRKFIYLGPS